MADRIVCAALLLAIVACGSTEPAASRLAPEAGGAGAEAGGAAAKPSKGATSAVVEPDAAGMGGYAEASAGEGGFPAGSGAAGEAVDVGPGGASGAAGEAMGGMGGEFTTDPVAGQAGATVAEGGAGGDSGDSAAGDSAAAGAGGAHEPDVEPWKICDSETCAANEICLHTKHGDQSSPRVCYEYPRPGFGDCDPNNLPDEASGVTDCCKNNNQPIECSRPYYRCSTMDDLEGNPCGWCDGNDARRWECGPPN